MSPAADPANLAALAGALVPAAVLQDGEAVILAVKPSRWYVLLVSWPVLTLAAVVVAATFVAGRLLNVATDERLMTLLCSAVACARVTLGCFQWQGRLYILTDRRVIRIRGIVREDIFQRPLKRLARMDLAATPPERLLCIASLVFEFDKPPADGDVHWTHLSSPQEVHRAVQEAWNRAR